MRHLLHRHTHRLLLPVLLGLLCTAWPALAQSGRITLSNNNASPSRVWRIEGEPTLVMNGFDLRGTNLRLPAVIESVTLDVFAFVPNTTAEVVVYEDPDSGSPQNARLVYQEQVAINTEGVFTVTLRRPAVVNSPIVWIGFYMPVGTEFRADTQGTSLLTYWGWTPGSTINVSNLSSATVFGPSDGSGPVNLNLGGVARIRAEARSLEAGDDSSTTTAPTLPNTQQGDPSVLLNYDTCPSLFKDESDVLVSYQGSIATRCQLVAFWNAPTTPSGFTRRSNERNEVYDLTWYDDQGRVLTGPQPIPVTHCVAPAADEIDRAIIGLAYGAPRTWQFLTTVRFGNLVCAEIDRGGSLSYFTPN